MVSRRGFVQGGAAAAGLALTRKAWGADAAAGTLEEVGYSQVEMREPRVLAQRANTHEVLMGLKVEDLVKPYRLMGGLDAPGNDIGGWYTYNADFNYKIWQKTGFCPGHAMGQWVSAMSRYYAATGDVTTRERVLAINRAYAESITTKFYEKTRFPAYTFDKLNCGLVDSAVFAKDPDAWKIMGATKAAVTPQLPGHVVQRGVNWRGALSKDESWTWDESYTLPENLYKAYSAGAGAEYRAMARQYLDDPEYFDLLAENEPAIAGKHAYSHVNAMSSAMQAYLVDGSEKHLRAAKNGFAMVKAQSFATGGWGPDEQLRMPGSDDLYTSLSKTHSGFETPCGAYGHMKLTRYLLRVTRDGSYGDSLERVLWNTVLGSLPLQSDGAAFYYQDVNFAGKRVYSTNVWPCCSGTLPQVAMDYGINSYFRERASANRPGSVWVSQYFASVLRWDEDGARMELEQVGEYPFADVVEMRVKASKPTRVALKLRVPAWSEGAEIRVNGKKVDAEPVLGFATVDRVWKSGDRVEMELPAKVRLEAISNGVADETLHPNVAAVVRGPLVLMAVMPSRVIAQPKVTREQALAAKRLSKTEWSVQTESGALRMVPYVEVGDAGYSTYLRLT
ncbi:hypothetical protein GOB94_04850 [Granulicella sp. 5B5]|uniref:beta-L-arabinofuranosidase domain-containing protein n=1 Tax=Granulicella sp. 5B5 TaxID=1617967 RepID=UPI0015F4B380|nr:beta-L-arabinofuranosidase domain-containing protein [Granulicella sp. 5B5]QMV18095.1 hypothetical protein GOB94_04850 [Granulicella sp. 5B5]